MPNRTPSLTQRSHGTSVGRTSFPVTTMPNRTAVGPDSSDHTDQRRPHELPGHDHAQPDTGPDPAIHGPASAGELPGHDHAQPDTSGLTRQSARDQRRPRGAARSRRCPNRTAVGPDPSDHTDQRRPRELRRSSTFFAVSFEREWSIRYWACLQILGVPADTGSGLQILGVPAGCSGEGHRFPGSHGPSNRNVITPDRQRKVNQTVGVMPGRRQRNQADAAHSPQCRARRTSIISQRPLAPSWRRM